MEAKWAAQAQSMMKSQSSGTDMASMGVQSMNMAGSASMGMGMTTGMGMAATNAMMGSAVMANGMLYSDPTGNMMMGNQMLTSGYVGTCVPKTVFIFIFKVVQIRFVKVVIQFVLHRR